MKRRRAPHPRLAARVRVLSVVRNPGEHGLDRLLLVLAALTAVALLAGCVVVAEEPPLPAEAERVIEGSVRPAPGERIRVVNLAGRVRVEAADGAEASVVATVHAGGEEDAEARTLAGSVELLLERGDGVAGFELVYPVDRGRTFHYPGHGSNVSFFGMGLSRTQLEYRGERVTVVSNRGGDAISLWVDLTVRVPAGTEVEIWHAAGDIEAEDISSGLVIEAQSGDVSVRGGSGAARVATGSGDVEVRRCDGAVVVTTGSGDVEVGEVAGDAEVQTGSGDIELDGVEGRLLRLRTGSGDVTLARVHGSLDLGTGSGDIEGTEVVLRDMLVAHTGSGEISLEGVADGLTGADLETGSGDIALHLDVLPALSLRLYSSSGDLDVDLPGLEVERQEHGSFVGHTGSEPRAEIRAESGSGSVTIRARR